MRQRSRMLLLLFALFAAACGTSVSDEEAALELRGEAEAAGARASASSDDSTAAAGESTDLVGDTSDPAAGADIGTVDGSAGSGSGATSDAASGGDTGGDAAAGGATGGTATTVAKTGAANVSTGGATDVGVTESEIRVGWVGTLTGPVPGLFRGALIGTQAWANYQNSKGGIMGRKVKVVPADDSFDSGKNRAAHLQLKDKVFSFVGSFSINDDGGAAVINACACPDVSGNLSGQMHNSAYHFGPQPAPRGWRSGPPRYYAKKYGKDVIEKLAFFHSQNAVAEDIARDHRRVYEQSGFKVVYSRAVPPNDNNQTADVVQMRQAGVRAVAFQGDLTSLGKLVNAIRQQNLEIDLLNLGNAIYDSNTFKVTTPDAMANVEIDQVYAMFLGEDGTRIPEVKLFNEWMEKTDPNQVVDLFSMYGWLSGRLFTDAMTKMAEGGKVPKRTDLVATLKGMGEWNGYGMVAPIHVGTKKPSDCFFIFTATPDGKFKRSYPTGDQNYACNDGPFVFRS